MRPQGTRRMHGDDAADGTGGGAMVGLAGMMVQSGCRLGIGWADGGVVAMVSWVSGGDECMRIYIYIYTYIHIYT